MADVPFSGVLVPNLTPFDRALQPDTAAFVAHGRWLLDQGADALAPFGTTGEGNSLSADEKITLLHALTEAGIPGSRIMPGTGCCALAESVRLTQAAVSAGCAGVLLLPPFFYKGVSDDGVFAAVAETIEQVGAAALRVYLYHIPPVAHVGFSLALVERLIKAYPDTVVGLKDSSGDWANTKALLDAFPGFSVFPGSEVFLLDGLRAGGAGCITATGNINVAAIAKVVTAHRSGSGEADSLQATITRTRKTVQAHPMIPALKTLAARIHGADTWRRPRPPLLSLPEDEAAILFDHLSQISYRMPTAT